MISDVDLSWLAAIVDGEGSMMIVRHRELPSGSWTYRPRLSVYNTFRPLVESCVERTGLGTVYQHTRAPHENHKATAYEWRVNTTELRVILPLLRPFLIAKVDQAEVLSSALAGVGKMREAAPVISALNRRGRKEGNK